MIHYRGEKTVCRGGLKILVLNIISYLTEIVVNYDI